MAVINHSLVVLAAIALFLQCPHSLIEAAAFSGGGGEWTLLQESVGLSAMHMQLLNNNKVVIFDRTNMGPSNLTFPEGKEFCLNYSINGHPPITDCTAHSLLYDVASNTFRPLTVKTDVWCSSGAVDPNGTLIQTGGFGNGSKVIRTFSSCDNDKCDWNELEQVILAEKRWYASSHILPDGHVIVLGGRRVYNYEFFPKSDAWSSKSYYLRFLAETTYKHSEENNLYPFLHLLPDGNLFLFASTRSILLDYINNRVIKEFPDIPGGIIRNYPSTGSSVLLPLKMIKGSDLPEVEVLICGGTTIDAFNMTNRNPRVFPGASKSCGRIKLTDKDPQWAMEEMPLPRVMGDMLLLPSGDVIIINGAANGSAGWEDAVNPVLNPVLYKTNEPNTKTRFITLNPTTIPRMYHSSAVLLPDGRILVGGSNPHERYNFKAEFPTTRSLEAYSPPYLGRTFSSLRPQNVSVFSRKGTTVSYGQNFAVKFQLVVYTNDPTKFSVVLMAPSFTTHSFSMSQRMLVLERVGFKHLHRKYRKPTDRAYDYIIAARIPSKNTVAPPGYYMISVVNDGVPSQQAAWVKLQ